MNILVCVKYVPGEVDLELNNAHHLNREAMAGVINPFDLYAMEAAARLKDEDDSVRITALTMGPQGAKKALKECLALGAEDAYLLTDDVLIGADAYDTAKALAKAVKTIERTKGAFDAIFIGSKTIDGNTSQLAMRLCEELGLPALTYALTATRREQSLEVLVENDEGNRVYDIKLPAVLSFTKAEFNTRYPEIVRIIESEHTDIPTLSAKDIGYVKESKKTAIHMEEAGFAPTEKQGLMIEEKLGEDSAKKLVGVLFEEHLL